MIDKLVLRCDFMKIQNSNNPFPDLIWPDFQLAELGIPLEFKKLSFGLSRRGRAPSAPGTGGADQTTEPLVS